MPSYEFQKSLTYLDQLKCFLQHSPVGEDKGLLGVRSSGALTFVDYVTALSQEDVTTLTFLVTSFTEQPPDISSASILLTTDGRQIVKPNFRPIGSSGFFTGTGENPESPVAIGNGPTVIRFDHVAGDNAPNFSRDIYFHVESNRSWLCDGNLRYRNALFDEFSFEIRPYVTSVLTGLTGTNFKLYKGYLLIPAAGDGTVDLDPTKKLYPCSVVPKTDTGKCPAAYWNLDYDAATNTYSNLTPASNPNSAGDPGNGKYNIFTADVCLKRYINRWGLLGDGSEVFYTSDPSEFGSYLRAVFKFTTIGHADPTQFVDHSWQILCNWIMFREKIT